MFTHRELPAPVCIAPLIQNNRILNALSRAEFESLSMHLKRVELRAGDILYRPDEPITHVYFPITGTVSIISVFGDGSQVEVGMVGNEGMFGVCVFLGSISTPLLAQVQMAGEGYKMRADVLKSEFAKCGALQDVLLRYTQAFMTQVALGAACNRAHHVEQRLARWLLMCQDRSHSDYLKLTHELISEMLGIRRAGVTEAACALKAAGVISYERGRITVLDREGLKDMSCECYPLMSKEFSRLFAGHDHAL